MALTYLNKSIKVSKLFCDKLSFTIDYKLPAEHLHIQQTIKEMGTLAIPYKQGHYKKGAKIFEGEYPSQMAMLMQWEPKHSGTSYLRVDFNPTHADMDNIHAILSQVLPGGYDDVLFRAVFTRFDATVDITGISPHQLLAYYPKKSITAVHCKSGLIETEYLGADGANQIVIYDKTLEIKEKKAKYNHKIPLPKYPTTRIEFRLRPGVDAAGLALVENPFINLVLKQSSLLPEVGNESWRLFIALAQVRGLQDALLLLDEGTRKDFKAKINAVSSSWWNPESIWNSWETLLADILFLKLSSSEVYIA